jgi:hypothetical protein
MSTVDWKGTLYSILEVPKTIFRSSVVALKTPPILKIYTIDEDVRKLTFSVSRQEGMFNDSWLLASLKVSALCLGNLRPELVKVEGLSIALGNPCDG